MLNLTVKELDETRAKSDKRMEDLTSQITNVQSEISRLDKKLDEIEKSTKNEERKSEAIKKALILVRGIPSKNSQIRNQLLRNMERAVREDITIAENKKIGIEIETLKTGLQKTCSHPFVYDEPGYEGSQSHDYENRYPGVRYCIICGFSEETYNSREVGPLGLQREYLFETLTPDKNRIIKSQPWTSEGRKRVNIWIPLGAVLKPFEDSVVKVLNG